MRCPRCDAENFIPTAPCPACDFSADPALLEELGHVDYLLAEVDRLRGLSLSSQASLLAHFRRRRRELETGLGLRPLTAEQAATVRREAARQQALLDRLASWQKRGWVRPEAIRSLLTPEVQARLAQAPPAPAPAPAELDADTLAFLREQADALHAQGGFPSDQAYQMARAQLALAEEQLAEEAEKEAEKEARLTLRTVKQARAARWELACQQAWLAELSLWLERGWARPGIARPLVEEVQAQIEDLQAALADAPRLPKTEEHSLDRLTILASHVRPEARAFHDRGGFVDEAAHAAALAELDARQQQWEDELQIPSGRLFAPTPEAEAEVKAPAFRLADFFNWTFFWQTLASERTLNAMLFIGAVLLSASAITLVIYKTLFPPLTAWEVSLLSAFILSFYSLGWFTQERLALRTSSVALTAVGAILLPVDAYAIYLAVGFPPGSWPWVWLAASAICLAAYLLTALRIQAEFFGYLVVAAAGSLLCAALQLADVPADLWTAALTLLALAVAWQADRLADSPRENWRVLARPFWYISLIGAGVLLSGTLAWYLAALVTSWNFQIALALDWWFGFALSAFAAARRRSPWLGRAAAVVLPVAVYLILRLFFIPTEVHAAWYALGWAALTPAYLALGHRLRQRRDDPVALEQGHTAVVGGVLLIALSALWALPRPIAAAPTHLILAGSVALAAGLWRRPPLLLATSLLLFSAVTARMAAANLTVGQLGLGWTLLAVLHLATALALRPLPSPAGAAPYATPLFGAGYLIAALAVFPPLLDGDRGLLSYALGNWIAIAAWSARLARRGDQPGLTVLLGKLGRFRPGRKPLSPAVFHWAAAVPIPFWLWITWVHFFRPADAWLGLGFVFLAWALVFLGRWLQVRHRLPPATCAPWYVVGYVCSLASPLIVYYYWHQPALITALALASALYFVSARLFRARWWLVPAGLTLPLAYGSLLDLWAVPWSPAGLCLALLPVAYLLGGLALERWRSVERRFLQPLYVVAHGLSALAVGWAFGPLGDRLVWGNQWPDPDRLWTTATLLLLGVTYGLVTWAFAQERWGHVAAWLGVVGGGILASVYSTGRGSSAAKAALIAIVYVLAERALHARRDPWPLANRAWPLYRRPLLVAGWTVSAGVIGLALIRNLLILGGGPVRETWAIVALLLIVGLYALSARLFRRPLFVWLAGGLTFVPWTLLTDMGWYVWPEPRLPRYALAWAILAAGQLALGLWLERLARPLPLACGFPLRVLAHLLLPFSLLWTLADTPTAVSVFGLGVGFYAVSAAWDHRRGKRGLAAARFLYPAAALVPVWALYILDWLAPEAPATSFGLLLWTFAPLGLIAGRRLRHLDPADALSAYLVAYAGAVMGTVLVAHQRPLLIVVLVLDVALAVVSAVLFREPLWGYPAAALAPLALLLALAELDVDPYRRGWYLIGLAAGYLALAWALRRGARRDYATPPLAAAYALVALGLALSSHDETGAFWGYGAAAGLYLISAVWLRQPLFFTPATGLLAVPYGVAIDWLSLPARDHGLALWPGIVATLLIAHGLDRYLGPGRIPTGRFSLPSALPYLQSAFLTWWGFPWYVWAYAATLVSIGFSWDDLPRRALVLGLSAAVYTAATLRFRRRGWLLLAALAAQGSVATAMDVAGWLADPARAARSFLPVIVVTALLALALERLFGEGPPLSLSPRQIVRGWSRPLYWLVGVDLAFNQWAALAGRQAGTAATVGHAVLIAFLATVWRQTLVVYLAVGWGVVALLQRLWAAPPTGRPVPLALLALAYGLIGYGLGYLWRRKVALPRRLRLWQGPLQTAGLTVSAGALGWAALIGPDIVPLALRALMGWPLLRPVDVPRVQMIVGVLAVSGLLYLTAAVVESRRRVGYGAVAMLLGAWSLEWFFVWGMRETQWYAIPAGLYLLAIGFLEWQYGSRDLARWIDRAAIVLLLGSSFRQSLLPGGWPYALLMGGEGLLLVWWGSARRQRRFLNLGVAGVVLDVLSQMVQPLLSANRWVVFGAAGLVVVVAAVVVERQLETLKQVSQEWRERLEEWE